MQQVQLYIEGNRVDMFKDESVVITDTIKDVKDVSKIFTEYSQTFQVPASKVNNKVFKHYYDNDIVGGFDARIRAAAYIELNSLPFKDGYIKLEGVDLMDNKAHTYRITFFGNTVSLKNLLGDDSLADLNWLNNFSEKDNGDLLVWNPSDIETYLESSVNRTVDGKTYYSPLQVPLITHTERLYYDLTEDIANSGNVHYNSENISENIHGVKWNELKYSLKLEIIIKAIEEQYGIVFSNDFFNNPSNVAFNNLSMWLHRTKGGVTIGSQVQEYKSFVTGWSNSVGSISTMSNSSVTLNYSLVDVLLLNITPSSASSNVSYSISVSQSGSVVYQSNSSTGSRSFNDIPKVIGAGYSVEITSNQIMYFDNIKWTVRSFAPDDLDTYQNTSFNTSSQFLFNIQQQIPEMKVLDFLTSIFNMFSLVAYFEGGFLVVETLDDYYSNGKGGNLNAEGGYDITKYVDVSKKQVDVALPFREINYSYKGLKTFLAKRHNQLLNEEWGTEKYSGGESTIFAEGIFNVKVPFEHMKFERLLDIANPTSRTDVQWGFCVDDNQSSYIGDPLIFYMRLENLSTANRISFVNLVDSENLSVTRKYINSYHVPSNSDLLQSQVEDRQSLNFNAAPDEWEMQTTQQSIFNNYHKNYISSVFAKSNRLTTVKAYLPLRILLKYKLSDRFIISGKTYKINSIETDFGSGQSSIELLSDVIIAPEVVKLIETEDENNLITEDDKYLQIQ